MKINDEILEAIKCGDLDKYELVVEGFQQQIFSYCFRMLRNVQEAEDASQDVFIKAYEKINGYRENVSFSAWLYRIAYNHCINVLKRRKLANFLHTVYIFNDSRDESIIEKRMYAAELNEEINDALSILSFEDRSILIFRAIEEKSYEEIALILGKKEAAVRKKHERARKKLGLYLENKREGVEDEKVTVL